MKSIYSASFVVGGLCTLLLVEGHAQIRSDISEATFVYDIYSENVDVGDSRVQVTRSDDGGWLLLQYSHIQTSGWWGDLDFRSQQYEVYSPQGRLQHADVAMIDGDDAYGLQLKTRGERVSMQVAEFKDLEAMEKTHLQDIALVVNGNTSRSLGEAVALSQSLFSHRKEFEDVLDISKNDFDVSFNYLPQYWLQQGKRLPKQIRVLDVEDIKVENYSVTDEGAYFHFISKGGAPLDIWLAVNSQGLPHFRLIKGEDEDGPYRIELKDSEGSIS